MAAPELAVTYDGELTICPLTDSVTGMLQVVVQDAVTADYSFLLGFDGTSTVDVLVTDLASGETFDCSIDLQTDTSACTPAERI